MDIDAEKKKLEDSRDFIAAYLEHPLSREVLLDNKDEQDSAINLICNRDVDSIASFFAHFHAVGYLAGLRRANSLMTDSLEDAKNAIKELE